MKFAVAVTLAVALCHVHAAPSSIPGDLLSTLRTQGKADVMLVFKESVKPVLTQINSQNFINSVEKTTHMVASLRQFTQKSQAPVLSYLNQNNVQGAKSFWITNRVFVPNASEKLVEKLVTLFADKIEIRLQVIASIGYTIDSVGDSRPTANEWGITRINAPALWEEGLDGSGVVVSHIDTGVRDTHESLAGRMRETHAWLDPYDGNLTPVDPQGHGTHTMGTIAGAGGIGVAPNATFITCRGCDVQGCTEEALISCGQFTTCPTLADGTGEDCSKKPTLSSNSWGGGSEDPFYNDVISAWRAANIVPIFAIGNSGPICRTANSPGDAIEAFSVGATTNLDAVASFSSHGPTLRTSRIKPEISAPGNNVRSAGHLADDAYATFSGTSMATPHVAGAVALLLQKDSSLSIDQITTLLKENNARPRIESIICTGGGVNATYPWPNNSFGNGRLDVQLAANAM